MVYVKRLLLCLCAVVFRDRFETQTVSTLSARAAARSACGPIGRCDLQGLAILASILVTLLHLTMWYGPVDYCHWIPAMHSA